MVLGIELAQIVKRGRDLEQRILVLANWLYVRMLFLGFDPGLRLEILI